jgi:hypothetical protein
MSQNDGYYEDGDIYDEETGLVIDDEVIDDGYETRYVEPQPNRYQEPVRRPNPQQAQRRPQPAGQAVLSPDGTMIELPAQQIYIGDVVGAGQGQPARPNRQAPLSYSQPMGGAPMAPRAAQPAVITLQNREYPNTYAQCMSTDNACISSYELQGYVRVQNLPQFAGYQEVLSPSDYPQGGRWRNNNNIPRW